MTDTAVKSPRYDEVTLKYADARQRQFAEAVNQCGSERAAARKLGVHHSTVQDVLARLRERAALSGHAPEYGYKHEVPPPFIVNGVTQNRDAVGNLKQEWIKSKLDWQRRWEMIKEALADSVKPIHRLAAVPAPKKVLSDDLANVITLTDCHIGMYAWDKEGGSKWDGPECERVLTGVFTNLIDQAPKADTLIIVQLGDFMHYDGHEQVTPTSKHILDAAQRPGEMVKTAIRILRRIVDHGLKTHKNVVLVSAEGNHDLFGSIWLRELFMALYEKEPRLKVIDNALPFYAYQHGNTALFWHHSHMKKLDQLPLLFATEFRKIWGDTEYHFGHTGDKHHLEEKEHSGIIMLQHPTLAARDAYASRHGWHALRRAIRVTYSKVTGEHTRGYFTPEMLDMVKA